jgi:hypothetical protein
MSTIRNTALATLLAFGTAAGAAQAHTVDAASIPGQAAGATGNVVGRAVATISGGGDDQVIEYGMGGAGYGSAGPNGQAARLAGFAGTDGDGPKVQYLEPAPAGGGRVAVMIGGGEDRAVVYVSPAARPGRG